MCEFQQTGNFCLKKVKFDAYYLASYLLQAKAIQNNFRKLEELVFFDLRIPYSRFRLPASGFRLPGFRVVLFYAFAKVVLFSLLVFVGCDSMITLSEIAYNDNIMLGEVLLAIASTVDNGQHI